MIVAFRHGYFALNERSQLTGEAAFKAMEKPIPPDADATMDLFPEGREQAGRVQQTLGQIAIHTCLRSPTLRTKTMAELALAGQKLPGGIQVVPELLERSRGIFSYAPEDWTNSHPDYPAHKSVLDWQPAGRDYNGNPGRSIRYMRDTRVRPVLQIVDTIDGTVALSTHAEWTLSLRAYYLKFGNDRFRLPLVPNPPKNHPALATAKFVVNGQVDMYDCTCSPRVPASAPERHMDIFRTIVTDPKLAFDTGWLPIGEMQHL